MVGHHRKQKPVLGSITLSSSSFTGGTASGTVVGTITVNMTKGSFAGGTLSLTGTNASSFQIVGTSLETNGVVASGSYSINIVATLSGAVGSPMTQAESITGSGGAAIAYSTGANPGTNPSNNGFPSPLTLSTTNQAGSAVSPLGWTVDFFDDFTGTFAMFHQANWYDDQVLGAGQNNAFRTGALYKGVQAIYPCATGAHWGGQYAGVDTLQNVGMANSLLTFNVTNVGGVIHTSSVCAFSDTPWGYWEWSVRPAHGANGNLNTSGWALWLSGSSWPKSGEFDIIESATGVATTGGIGSNIHCGATDIFQNGIFSASTFNGGVHWDDGNFHTIGGLITPSYLATYADGYLVGYGSAYTAGGGNSRQSFLVNLSTVADPPTTTYASGSFGYSASTIQGSLTDVSYNYSNTYSILFGYEVTSSATTAFCPTKMDVDWWRHSKLYPASGGPHV